MDYMDVRLGDFLNNIVMMSDVEVYNTSDDTLLFRTRISGMPDYSIEDSSLPENADLNNYGIEYVSSTDRGLEIGVVEV